MRAGTLAAMVLGWVSVALGIGCLGMAAFALARSWTPQRWGGRYKHFAVAMSGVAVAMVTYGIATMTEGTVSSVARALTLAGFLLAAGGLLSAHRVAARDGGTAS